MKTRARVAACFVLVASIAAFCQPSRTMASEPIDVKKALDVIRAHEASQEAKIRNIQWNVRWRKGKLLSPIDLSQVRIEHDPNYFGACSVLYEPATSRYRIDMELVEKWYGGLEDYYSAQRSMSYDGQTERGFVRGQGGTRLPPPDKIGDGTIRHENWSEFMRQEGLAVGIGYVPPNHFSDRLSSFLQKRIDSAKSVQVEQQGNGMWLITTTPAAELESGNDLRIQFDPVRGIVLSGEIYGKQDLGNKWAGRLWSRQVVAWREAQKNLWLPERYEWWQLADMLYGRLDFLDMKINEKIDEGRFTFQFPIGTRMYDEVEKKIYRVSGGVVNEQEAIRQFIESERLRDAPRRTFWSRWRWYILAGAGILGVAAVLLRRWWRARVAVLMLGVVMALGVNGVVAVEPGQDGSWMVTHSKHESFAISQCGLNETRGHRGGCGCGSGQEMSGPMPETKRWSRGEAVTR